MGEEGEEETAVTEQEFNDIQKAGANARALGRLRFDNPYLEPGAVQACATGEEWTAKYEAWDLGWAMEDAMRPSALDLLMADLLRK